MAGCGLGTKAIKNPVPNNGPMRVPVLGTAVAYEGDFLDRERTGRGVYTWPSGSRYEGDFVDDLPHGHGTYTNSKGRRYEGQRRKGCFRSRGEEGFFIGTTAKACGFK